MQRVFVKILLFLSFNILFGVSCYAQNEPFGDLGKPDNYEQTIKSFSALYRGGTGSGPTQLPSSFNWMNYGAVTPAKNQGSCGSCWAFASTGVFESKILIANGPLLNLSEQQQISCNSSQVGCSGGYMDSLMFWYTEGPMNEDCTGYCSCNTTCSTTDGCCELPFNTKNYYTVDTSSQHDMKASIYTHGPAFFRYDVYDDFYDFWHYGSAGDVYSYTSGNKLGGHAVLVIGWDDQKGAWLCKNSWGAYAGPQNNGTFWIAYSSSVDLNFGMANVELEIPPGKFVNNGSWTGASNGDHGWYVGDFNGDGKDDIFRYRSGSSGAEVFLSNGTEFVNNGSWTAAGTSHWYVGDFNGDGKDDIFRYRPGYSGAEVFLSDGTKFVKNGSWTGASNGDHGWYVGDFNGDGKDDIFRYRSGSSGAEVFLSNGTKFVNNGSWTAAGTSHWHVGDFNGDGKDDIFRYQPGSSGAEVFLSNGTEFVNNGSWTAASNGDHGWYIGDFNGDSKYDIFRYRSDCITGADVFLSTGAAFFHDGWWTSAGTSHWHVGDFDGDGKDDIFRYLEGYSGAEVFLAP